MAEINTGLRRILTNPSIYEMFQWLLGGSVARKEFVKCYIKPFSGMRLLDIGCGPAEILGFLPDEVEYIGFDASSQYIARARQKYGNRGHFHHDYVNNANVASIGKIDLVLAIGVFHHLDDIEVIRSSELAYTVLKSGGKFISIDPCYEDGQSRMARYIINRDRGQNVRYAQQYQALIEHTGQWTVRTSIRHDLLNIPYTHAILECRK